MTFLNKIKSAKEGSTLMEIIVVVIILAVLTAVMLPQFLGKTEDAEATGALSDMNTAAKYVGIYVAENTSATAVDAAFAGDAQVGAAVAVTAVGDTWPVTVSSPDVNDATIEIDEQGNMSRVGAGWNN